MDRCVRIKIRQDREARCNRRLQPVSHGKDLPRFCFIVGKELCNLQIPAMREGSGSLLGPDSGCSVNSARREAERPATVADRQTVGRKFDLFQMTLAMLIG